MSANGRFALSTSLARLAHARPIVGYAGVNDPFKDDPHPRQDGIHSMDLETGKCRLVLSLDTVAQLNPLPSMQGELHRFEHVMISPDDRRFMVIHRWPRRAKGRPFFDRMLTANVDGSDLYCLAYNEMVSHFCWRDPEYLLAWSRHVLGRRLERGPAALRAGNRSPGRHRPVCATTGPLPYHGHPL